MLVSGVESALLLGWTQFSSGLVEPKLLEALKLAENSHTSRYATALRPQALCLDLVWKKITAAQREVSVILRENSGSYRGKSVVLREINGGTERK